MQEPGSPRFGPPADTTDSGGMLDAIATATASAAARPPGTAVGLLLVGGLGAVVVLALALIATTVVRAPARRRAMPSSSLANRVLRDEHGLGEEELGRYFFLPTVREAWREVCEADGADAPWTHPLIGEALDRIAWTTWDPAAPIEHAQFASVYQSLRRIRLARCAAAYDRPLSGVG